MLMSPAHELALDVNDEASERLGFNVYEGACSCQRFYMAVAWPDVDGHMVIVEAHLQHIQPLPGEQHG